jgi:hypothetical protein
MTTETELLQDDVLSTPELETPAEPADAHRGTIIGVTSRSYDTGSTSIDLALRSDDQGFETSYSFFPPKEFVENIHVNPTELSDESPGTTANGNPKQSPQQRYAVTVANDKKTAEIQSLRILAQEQGKNLAGAAAPVTFEDYVSLLNSLLNGVEVVFTRKPDNSASDPRYRGKLKVSSIYSPDVVNKPKSLKNFIKRWNS